MRFDVTLTTEFFNQIGCASHPERRTVKKFFSLMLAAMIMASIVSPPPANAKSGVKTAVYVLTGAVLLNALTGRRGDDAVSYGYRSGGYDATGAAEQAAFIRGRADALREQEREYRKLQAARERAAYERGRASLGGYE
ncbi:MAG: hypothetical protein COZ49_00630 [Candidatus Yonathbacteria bacterium CG_4_10_14_3_um_filter_47_65]|uniref:Uncharacterized protein n=2 Tax=Parcubacteria group TaxID=1794811 RepID=A0A2M8D900_9BACT|nr:MAG: hypothetical protein AUJ44_00650 [Candidatus Nomurabacteria bacterium CG1_02_47_685]PIP03927.1 MAG: hypothetical protein COX54_01815 [Candidatus Yonathbacteria bacterium CG23_combo_of_CG06-09_8_20_14_all_46_18]PIQ31314.1 MAG: hypothetical protein COW61_03925 [Candidatus Yonathbacteria bacterium CG17_big_fil_post_rev_8_21_14_2_50_46_19]PIX56718.1 MAG: hypothetical protein COZ49_00630 [Candidatus Yonathbacteria bacterium CG_4_10_14_3_um_filter_47_65]PIY57245.1 MAG: hypothetical protein CO